MVEAEHGMDLTASIVDPAFSLGGKIGVSLILKDKISINLDYLGLGTHNVLIETRTLPNYIEEASIPLIIHFLALSIGLKF